MKNFKNYLGRLRKKSEVIGVTSDNEQLSIAFTAIPESNENRNTVEKLCTEATDKYKSTFLAHYCISDRCQAYIDKDLYLFTKNLLSNIAPDLSFTGFLTNVLSKHLEDNKEEIEKLYADKVNSMKTNLLWKK